MEPKFLALKEHGRRSTARRFRFKTQITGTPTRRKFPTDPNPKHLCSPQVLYLRMAIFKRFSKVLCHERLLNGQDPH